MTESKENSRLLSESFILDVLKYVSPSEVRILAASGGTEQVEANVEFRSVQYTVEPVRYLSLAELFVSVAQAAQLLVHLHVEAEIPHLLSALETARLEHRIYFSRFDARFKKKHPAENYTIAINLTRVASLHESWFGHFRFAVSDFVTGSFFGVVERLGARQ